MRTNSLLLLTAALVGLAAAAGAQPLTLDACVRIALDKNPAHRAALEGVAGAKSAVGEAKAPYYPDLSFTSAFGHWQRHAFLPSAIYSFRPGIPTVIGPTDDWSAGFRSRLTLFDFGERRAQLRAALAREGAAEQELARVRQDLALNVHQAFHAYMAAVEARAVAARSLARAEEHLRLARERKAAGAVPQADVVRSQVEVANAKLALVRAGSLVDIAAGALNTAMGLPADMKVEIQAQPGEVVPPEQVKLGEALEEAARSREIVRASEFRVDAARAAVAGARSSFLPRLRSEGSFGWHDAKILPRDKEWAMTVGLELPIFDGFARKNRLARAKADLAREEADRQRLALSVRNEVWASFSRLKESYEAVRATDSVVNDAREGERLARERYQAGAGTVNDLLDAETALARAEATRVETLWEYQTSRAVFERAAGRLAPPEKR